MIWYQQVRDPRRNKSNVETVSVSHLGERRVPATLWLYVLPIVAIKKSNIADLMFSTNCLWLFGQGHLRVMVLLLPLFVSLPSCTLSTERNNVICQARRSIGCTSKLRTVGANRTLARQN